MSIDERIDVIGRHPFRARFHPRGRERAIDVICRWTGRELAAAA